MKPKKWWTVYWTGWVFAGFLIPELFAVFDKGTSGDTFSESLWAALRTWPLLKIPIVVLLGWLFHHFVLDRRSKRKR